MNFEILEKFDWYNDPENVRFEDDGMCVYAKSNTDFWQSLHRGYRKDDGHLFFCREKGDFEVVLKWSFEKKQEFLQCGVMVRIDERNWCKGGIEKETSDNRVLFSSFTKEGHSNWARGNDLGDIDEVWFKVVRVQNEYSMFYSLDGNSFIKFAMFYMENFEDIKVGGYICSLGDEEVVAKVSGMEVIEC